MNKIKFTMSEEDYCSGFLFKFNRLGYKEKGSIVLMLLLGILIAVSTAVFNLSYWAYSLSIIMILTAIMMIASPTKNNIRKEYHMFPFSKNEKTIFFDDCRICFISAFEKIDMKTEDICAYKISDDRVIIQPLGSSEFFSIDRNKYACEELDALCTLLRTRCKEKNVGKNIIVTENEPIQNNADGNEAKIPFSFEMMINQNDCIDNQKMALKRNRVMMMMYVFSGFYAAVSLYNYITSKDTAFLITIALIAASTAVYVFYNYFIASKILARRMNRIDKFFQLKRKVYVSSQFIEIKTVSPQNGIEIERVLPYPCVSLVTETGSYFSIIGADKHIFLPKRHLSDEQKIRLTELLSSKCQYIRTK